MALQPSLEALTRRTSSTETRGVKFVLRIPASFQPADALCEGLADSYWGPVIVFNMQYLYILARIRRIGKGEIDYMRLSLREISRVSG